MYKRIQQFLITRYPLLWNTRIVLVLPAAFLIHLLFYLAGYLDPIGLDELTEYERFRIEEEMMLSMLTTAILIIVWLVFYLRNNPFKSFYILPAPYLFYEFLLILLVFLSSATFFLSYEKGLYDIVDKRTGDTDLKKEADLLNLAHHFISFTPEHVAFKLSECCDSLRAREVRDSIRRANKYDYVSEDLSYNDAYPPSYLYYCGQATRIYDHESYMFRKELPPLFLASAEQLHDITERWLKGQQKDSVLQLMRGLTALCDKYGAKHSFSAEEQVRECFSDSNFIVHSFISSSIPDYDPLPYIQISKITDSLEKTRKIRSGVWRIELLLAILYYAFSAAILLFSFRVTKLKPWFIAAIGTGIWGIILALIAVALRLQEGIMIVFALLWFIFLLYSHGNIYGRSQKLFSGISYLWVTWFLPAILPIVFFFIYDSTHVNCHGDPCPPEPAIAYWIQHNWILIFALNLLVFVAVLYLYLIPMVRKWQANPEE